MVYEFQFIAMCIYIVCFQDSQDKFGLVRPFMKRLLKHDKFWNNGLLTAALDFSGLLLLVVEDRRFKSLISRECIDRAIKSDGCS